MIYKITKEISGFSVCFRQWRANSHCKFLHGYAIKFKLFFESYNLNQQNWVLDFGFLKNKEYKIDDLLIKDWFRFMFDHTVIIDAGDPFLNDFKTLAKNNLIQLRIIDNFSCEGLCKYVFLKLQNSLKNNLLKKVQIIENENNTASFEQ